LARLEDCYRGHGLTSAEAEGWAAEFARWGVPLRAQAAGWHLDLPEPPWAADQLAAALGLAEDEIGIWPLCDSSNTRLLAALQLRLGLAEAQWAGHGQRGRHWHSPFGKHLYCSLAVEISPSRAGLLPLVAGLGVYQVLQAQIPELWLKWPNDLWVGQRKLAGLLVEGRHGPAGQRWVLGLGINLHADPALPASAISLAELGIALPRQALLLAILRQWQADFPLLEEAGLAAFDDRWQAANRLHGRWVEVEEDGCRSAWQVVALEENGALRVGNGRQQLTLDAGSVRLRPRP